MKKRSYKRFNKNDVFGRLTIIELALIVGDDHRKRYAISRLNAMDKVIK